MTSPIKPSEVDDGKFIPDVIFQIFNAYIQERWNGHEAVLKQDILVNRIVSALGCDRQVVFDRGYLNIERAYEKVGWKVEYDKPGYNETYPAAFTFRKKKR